MAAKKLTRSEQLEKETRDHLRPTHGELGEFLVETEVTVEDETTGKKKKAWVLYREARSEKAAGIYKEMAEDDGLKARIVKVSDEY